MVLYGINTGWEQDMNNLSVTRENTTFLHPDGAIKVENDFALNSDQAGAGEGADINVGVGAGAGRHIFPMSKTQDLPEISPDLANRLKVYDEVIHAMGSMIEVRDVYTAGHQQKVARISVEIARNLALPAYQIKGIQLAAKIHDIGKLAIPSEILSKPGKLSAAEFDMIKTHSGVGFAILRDIEFPWPIAQTVLQHHERMNGTGYPNRLSRYNILLEAKIIAVADVVEAMASDRPYRPSRGIGPAMEEISRNKHELYDENVVDACLQVFNNGRFVM
jgi:HD-GYP domain-containing protein (c-di-GMP phosphodiesterase class II)